MAGTQYYDITPEPLVAEKSMAGIAEKRYYFLIHPEANKTVIKEAMEEVFAGTKVKSISTINRPTKIKHRGTTVGQTVKSKKAIVQLTADSKGIEIFQGL